VAQIIIQVSSDVAHALCKAGPPTTESQEILEVAEELGVILEPLHPGARDPQLTQYFTLELPRPTKAKRVLARLQRCRAIKAAYVKPSDGMP
jgi:hypothetical protein